MNTISYGKKPPFATDKNVFNALAKQATKRGHPVLLCIRYLVIILPIISICLLFFKCAWFYTDITFNCIFKQSGIYCNILPAKSLSLSTMIFLVA